MKRKILKHDKFLIYVFNMKQNEIKKFVSDELSRKLQFPIKFINYLLSNDSPLPEPRHWHLNQFTKPSNSIGIVVKGSFQIHRGDIPPYIVKVGDGAFRYIYSTTGNHGLSMKALENDSMYHCILPREHIARYWERKLYYTSDAIKFETFKESFIFISAGKVKILGKEIAGPTMVNISGTSGKIEPLEKSIFTRIWID